MIVVGVGDEHEVDPVEQLSRNGGREPSEVGDAGAQQRIGQDREVVELDQERRVSEIGEPHSGYLTEASHPSGGREP